MKLSTVNLKIDKPYFKCEEAEMEIEESENRTRIHCNGFYFGNNEVCTICKQCKFKKGVYYYHANKRS
jgi:hypothetical protein